MKNYNTYEILSEVYFEGLATFKHSHKQSFPEELNVFGRVLEYHKYMYKTFPNRKFKLIEAKLVKD